MSRLTDPKGCVSSAKLKELDKKLSNSITSMARATKDGGNPFLYAFIFNKPHELTEHIPFIPRFSTAATDGKQFFWHPGFLDKLTPFEVTTIIMHESNHIISFHVERFKGKDKKIWNIAIDYIANSRIEYDYKKSNRGSALGKKPGLWGGNIGTPLSLKHFIKYIDGHSFLPKGKVCFTDQQVLNRTPESVYEEILNHWQSSKKKCNTCGDLSLNAFGNTQKPGPHGDGSCKSCGSEGDGLDPIDGHMPVKLKKHEVVEDLMRATEQAKTMEAGSIPAHVESILGELVSPTVSLIDYIRMSCMNKSKRSGFKNDWKRPRKRGLSVGLYLPKRHSFKSKWLAMIDTSASMSKKDISFGISQLQSLGDETDGIVVPADASIHWNRATEIRNATDLAKTSIVGRGGTLFDNFFADLPNKLGYDFELIIIITDGLVKPPPSHLAPPVDCLWVITRKETKFKPTFGRVIPLHT